MKRNILSFSIQNILAPSQGEKDSKPSVPEEITVSSSGSPISSIQQKDKVDEVIKQENNDSYPDSTVPEDDKKESSRRKFPCILTAGGVSVTLLDSKLWEDFNSLGTEMIITKAGRRMFPTLKVSLSGLKEDILYDVGLRLESVDRRRYRYVYQSSEWVVCGGGEPDLGAAVTHHHPSNPAHGSFWNSQHSVTFDRIKLTNNREPLCRHQVCLHSMHKYQPVIEVRQHCKEREERFSTSFTFPQTAFTTVTAYQNQQITKLKIASNPFAKGFRESTRPRETEEWRLLSGVGVGIPLLVPSLSPLVSLQLYRYHQQFSTLQSMHR